MHAVHSLSVIANDRASLLIKCAVSGAQAAYYCSTGMQMLAWDLCLRAETAAAAAAAAAAACAA